MFKFMFCLPLLLAAALLAVPATAAAEPREVTTSRFDQLGKHRRMLEQQRVEPRRFRFKRPPQHKGQLVSAVPELGVDGARPALALIAGSALLLSARRRRRAV